MSTADKRQQAVKTYPGLSLSKRCKILGVSRSTIYYKPKGESALNEVDRKSTRLNSSHVRISYAVFCLKKKKKTIINLKKLKNKILSHVIMYLHIIIF